MDSDQRFDLKNEENWFYLQKCLEQGQKEWQEAKTIITKGLSTTKGKSVRAQDILVFNRKANCEQHIQQYTSEHETKALSPELTFPMLNLRDIWIFILHLAELKMVNTVKHHKHKTDF